MGFAEQLRYLPGFFMSSLEHLLRLAKTRHGIDCRQTHPIFRIRETSNLSRVDSLLIGEPVGHVLPSVRSDAQRINPGIYYVTVCEHSNLTIRRHPR